MATYESQLESLKKVIEESEGVIQHIDRKTLEEVYTALANNPETQIVSSVAASLRGVLEHIDLYRYTEKKEKSQILTPRKMLTKAINLLEDIAKSQ
ncbi:hypothetical protein HYT57_02720 [Candidatus Woesearchaeota archaeon]|nr:hypothetical protein [Candidatus Woesearchaeota archaeon]